MACIEWNYQRWKPVTIFPSLSQSRNRRRKPFLVMSVLQQPLSTANINPIQSCINTIHCIGTRRLVIQAHQGTLSFPKSFRTFLFLAKAMQELFCIPCSLAKTKRAPVKPSFQEASSPLELIYLDVSGPVQPSLGGSTYAISYMDHFTAKSDVQFLKKRSELPSFLSKYMNRVENETGHRVLRIRLDGAGENMSNTIRSFCYTKGIILETSPPHALQSNLVAE